MKDFLANLMLRSLRAHRWLSLAGSILIDAGFNNLGLAAISASTDLDNVMSKKVLAKLGFQFSKRITTADKVLNRDIELDVFELKRIL